jgi:ribosome-associated protein
MLQVTESITIPDEELQWTYARSGGPGGQNVNKVASKAVLRWNLAASPSVPAPVKERLRTAHPAHVTVEGEFLVTSQKYRDQERNRADCLEKLAAMVRRAATPPTPRKATKPTKASKRRRLVEKKHRAERNAGRRGPGEEG